MYLLLVCNKLTFGNYPSTVYFVNTAITFNVKPLIYGEPLFTVSNMIDYAC